MAANNRCAGTTFWPFVISGAGTDLLYPAQTNALVALLSAASQ